MITKIAQQPYTAVQECSTGTLFYFFPGYFSTPELLILIVEPVLGAPTRLWRLMREQPQNKLLPMPKCIRKNGMPSGIQKQVVHGCRQLLSWHVGLSSATSAALVFSCCTRGIKKTTLRVRKYENGVFYACTPQHFYTSTRSSVLYPAVKHSGRLFPRRAFRFHSIILKRNFEIP